MWVSSHTAHFTQNTRKLTPPYPLSDPLCCCVPTQVRRVGSSAVGGFAGVAVDGLALLERLESKLEDHPGQLQRAAVELAKMWRQVCLAVVCVCVCVCVCVGSLQRRGGRCVCWGGGRKASWRTTRGSCSVRQWSWPKCGDRCEGCEGWGWGWVGVGGGARGGRGRFWVRLSSWQRCGDRYSFRSGSCVWGGCLCVHACLWEGGPRGDGVGSVVMTGPRWRWVGGGRGYRSEVVDGLALLIWLKANWITQDSCRAPQWSWRKCGDRCVCVCDGVGRRCLGGLGRAGSVAGRGRGWGGVG